MAAAIKLTSAQMAEFAARGVLRFEGVVPEHINQSIITSIDQALTRARLPRAAENDLHALYGALLQHAALPFVRPGSRWRQAFPTGTALGQLLRLPTIQGAIQSLVGSKAVVDHHFLHLTVPPGKGQRRSAQHYHQDSTIDVRKSFDIQLLYFPQAVTETMGGTRYLPGSHLRIVSESAIARYQNIIGQEHLVGPAGTVLVLHHGIWHGGGANRSAQRRTMWKLRLCPQQPQVRLWDTSDLALDHARQQPIFWADPAVPRDPVQATLMRPEPWFEADTSRLELMNRVRFWRRLLGQRDYDADYWLTRLENEFVD